MIGEISIGGVYFPALLLLGGASLLCAVLLSRIFQALGVYRYVAYRPIVDLSLFIALLGLAAFLSAPLGPHL